MISPLLRFSGAAAVSLAAVCAVGAWPTWRISGADGLSSMAIAAAVSLLGAVLGFVPSALAPTRYESRVQAAMLGVAVRLFATLAAVLVVTQGDLAPARTPFVVWMGLGYATLLVLETVAVLRLSRGTERKEGAASA